MTNAERIQKLTDGINDAIAAWRALTPEQREARRLQLEATIRLASITRCYLRLRANSDRALDEIAAKVIADATGPGLEGDKPERRQELAMALAGGNGTITASRCDECDPSFGCFDGRASCQKRPPLRAQVVMVDDEVDE